MQTLEPQNLAYWELNIEGEINLLEGIFNGIGQVFFLDNTISGIIIYLAAIFGREKAGILCSHRKFSAIIIAYFLGGEHSLIAAGFMDIMRF